MLTRVALVQGLVDRNTVCWSPPQHTPQARPELLSSHWVLLVMFVERPIGTIRREYLDRIFFWNAVMISNSPPPMDVRLCTAYRCALTSRNLRHGSGKSTESIKRPCCSMSVPSRRGPKTSKYGRISWRTRPVGASTSSGPLPDRASRGRTCHGATVRAWT